MSHSRSSGGPGGHIRTNYQTQPQTTSSHSSSHSSAPSKPKVPIQYSALEMKRKLTAMLEKEKCETYLRILGQMLTGDLAKADFDKQIRTLLTEEQRKLHNLFVITLLRSAYGSIATSNTQRRNVKVAPLVPRLGPGSRELSRQPIWAKIKAKMASAGLSQGLGVDNEAVSAVVVGLEHHLKSIMSVAQPTSRVPQRIMVSPIIQHLAKLENKEVLERTKKGDITAKDVCSALSIVPNVFDRKRVCFDDDIHLYHVQNHFAHVHYINFEVAKKEKEFERQREELTDGEDGEKREEERIENLEDMNVDTNNNNNKNNNNNNNNNNNDDDPPTQKQVHKPSAKATPLTNSATKRKGAKK